MAGVSIAAEQQLQNFSKGEPLSELATIAKSNSRALCEEEIKARLVQKNKVFNPITLHKQWAPIIYEQLARKLNQAKLMKFITYLVAEFYQKVVVAADEQSFTT